MSDLASRKRTEASEGIGPPCAPADEFSFGGLRLVASNRVLEKDGRPIALGARAFDILHALASGAPEVVDRQSLIAAAWPHATVGETSLRHHIAELRRAVRDAGIRGDLILTVAGRGYVLSQTVRRSTPAAPVRHKASTPSPSPNSAETAAALARLTEANQELLDLLKKQQAVLEDIQFDRRLQSRQISSLEDRLEESLQENSQLQAKIAKLEEQISLGPTTDAKSSEASSSTPAAPKAIDAPPPPPSTYLPPPESEGAPDTKSWHRLFTLSGTDGKKSDLFKIEGRQWRVLWHNLDQPGDVYKNTSALFISAFPKDDTIPQNVCSKLGTGGDSTELNGPGEFYLKIEASGGSWELAVEDFK